jgi:hypothetical protein
VRRAFVWTMTSTVGKNATLELEGSGTR